MYRCLFVAIVALLLAGCGTSARPQAAAPLEPPIVIDVVHGDSLEVFTDVGLQLVRLKGVSAPLLWQCFGQEAYDATAAMLEGRQVRIEFDNQRERNAGLLYIWIGDTLYNEWMIRQGFARVQMYDLPYRYRDALLKAEAEAQKNGRGLWANDCD